MIKEKLRRYFIPNQDNNYEPHILQRTAVGVMLFLVLISFAISNLQALFLLSSDWFVSTILPAVIVDITNENRSEEQLDMLTRSPLLDAAATLKAQHMAENEYFAHNSPDGITPWYWFRQVGYTYTHAGENLAVHFTDSKEVVDAWMDSPGHRANILDGEFTEIGIGTAKGEYKGFPTVFVVQLFGRPAQPVAVAPTPAPAPTPTPTPAPIAVAEGEGSALPEETPADQLVVAAAEDSGNEPVADVSEPTDTDQATATDETIESGEEAEGEGVPHSDTPIAPHGMARLEIATTSGLPPADGVGIGTTQPTTPGGQFLNMLERMATQPTKVLSIIYAALATFVVVVLILSIVIEWRRQRPVQIAYGTGLLALMTVMWYVQHMLVSGALIT